MKHTIPPIITLTAGLLFGFGLALSDMISPLRVQGFFDIFGSWDPTLLFVMFGALIISLFGHFFLSRQDKPFFSEIWHFSWKKSGILDKNLIFGSAIFGIGWGLAGLCPGPAIGSIVYGNIFTVVFLASMIATMSVYKFLTK
ncbi:YeeE/YedE family protein [Candidatus Gracilibacteria bacterium]|nr:YeeE/YedE family protein [Candidatus Gracilibacteria bacterium]